MKRFLKRIRDYRYMWDKINERHVVVWTHKDWYYGRYLDDPYYDLFMFDEDDLVKPRITIKRLWMILKFIAYDWRESR